MATSHGLYKSDGAAISMLAAVWPTHQGGVGYFRLPSTTSSIGAPSIARLMLFFLIIAGKATKRNTKVHVVIDEFQRIASENLEQLLQLARSHDIGLVLCNQSMSDLRANSSKVYHAVSGNCALRQWYSVNSVPDIEILEKLMGTHEEVQKTTTHGTQNSSTSYHSFCRTCEKIAISDTAPTTIICRPAIRF